MRWLTEEIAFLSRNRNIKEPQVKSSLDKETSKLSNFRLTVQYFHLTLSLTALKGSHGVRKLSD